MARNHKPEQFGIPACESAWYSKPYVLEADDFWDGEYYYDEPWVEDNVYSWARPRSSALFTIPRDEAILKRLSLLKRNPYVANFFEDVFAGSFILVIETDMINNIYTYERVVDYDHMTVHLSEQFDSPQLDGSKQGPVEVRDDKRFNFKGWAERFNTNVAVHLTLQETVDVIKHCIKLDRLQAFK